MLRLNPVSSVPLYVQLHQQIRYLILTGQLRQENRLPSVRHLSAELHINPLTVAKVYQILRRDGLVETKQGTGTYVSRRSPSLKMEARPAQLDLALEQLASEAFHLGIGEAEVHALLADKFRRIEPRN